MYRLTGSPRRRIITGSMAAMAIIAAALLAVFFMAGSTQAQQPPFPDPMVCGPGFDEFYDLPDSTVDQVYEGHYAVFDAYYDKDADEPHRPTEEGQAWAGLMSLNFCPPELEDVLDEDEEPTGEFTRHQANIDIDSTVFHVIQEQHTLTGDEVEAYPFLGDENDMVYWIRVGDDRNTSDVTEQASEFQISFSTALFDAKYWYRRGTEQPLWYEVEAVRELGVHPREYGHIYVFDASNAGAGKKAIWNSKESDTGKIYMEPGQNRNLQWVFTKAGTYEIEVHLNGHVRKEKPDDLPEGELWHPISTENTVTSDVRTYTFVVGPLTLDEQPMFKAPDRKIPENSPGGTNVGDPVPVTRAGEDELTYRLSGDGHTDFEVVSVAGGGQIRVASGAVVDYETRAAYDLVLSVSDGKNREGDDDQLRVDSTIAVKITLEDVFERTDVSVSATVSPETQSRSGEVTFTATAHNLPHGLDRTYVLRAANSAGNPGDVRETSSLTKNKVTETMTLSGPGHAGTRYYMFELTFTYDDNDTDTDNDTTVYSGLMKVDWQ